MEKLKLVQYNTSCSFENELQGEWQEENVQELEEVITEQAKVQQSEEPKLISMKDVEPDEVIISIPLIVKNEKTNITIPFKDFGKLPISKDPESDAFHLHLDENLEKELKCLSYDDTHVDPDDCKLKSPATDECKENISPKDNLGDNIKENLDTDPFMEGNEEDNLLSDLNKSVDKALFSTSLKRNKKLLTQVGISDDGTLCTNFPFAKKVNNKLIHSTLGLMKGRAAATFPNPNIMSENFQSSEMEKEEKKSELIDVESIFQPGKLDVKKFAKGVLESSYEIIENKDGSDHVMDEILDLSTKSSSDYHEKIDARVAELNSRQCEFSPMDTSVNSQSDLDNKADDGTSNGETTLLPENSSGFEVDTCHEDQSVDGANI